MSSEKRRRYPVAKVKGGWTTEEDELLGKLCRELGEGNWSLIAKTLNDTMGKGDAEGRIGKQCRERWSHHLHPDLRKDAWTGEEEAAFVCAHRARGNCWSAIARDIPGRSENAVKNHWNATLRRKHNSYSAAAGTLVLRTYMQELRLIPHSVTSPPPPAAAQQTQPHHPPSCAPCDSGNGVRRLAAAATTSYSGSAGGVAVAATVSFDSAAAAAAAGHRHPELSLAAPASPSHTVYRPVAKRARASPLPLDACSLAGRCSSSGRDVPLPAMGCGAAAVHALGGGSLATLRCPVPTSGGGAAAASPSNSATSTCCADNEWRGAAAAADEMANVARIMVSMRRADTPAAVLA